MNVIWMEQAERDLDLIIEYIAVDNMDAAEKIDNDIHEAVYSLGAFPKKGKCGRVPNTRELVVHKHYIIVYELNQDAVLITAVLHTARMWPRLH